MGCAPNQLITAIVIKKKNKVGVYITLMLGLCTELKSKNGNKNRLNKLKAKSTIPKILSGTERRTA